MSKKTDNTGTIEEESTKPAVGDDKTTVQRRSRWAEIQEKIEILQPWGILVAVVALSMAVAQFWLDYGDRTRQREVNAWQLLGTVTAGNSGKIEALQYLNREVGLFCVERFRGRLKWRNGDDREDAACLISLKPRTPLVGLQMVGPNEDAEVYLRGVDLPGAIFRDSHFERVNLIEADLNGADLRFVIFVGSHLDNAMVNGANLSFSTLDYVIAQDAQFVGANFNGASLHNVQFTNADLTEADFSGADIFESNFHNADLRNADFSVISISGSDLSASRNLRQEQLDEACGEDNRLPEGLTIEPCFPF